MSGDGTGTPAHVYLAPRPWGKPAAETIERVAQGAREAADRAREKRREYERTRAAKQRLEREVLREQTYTPPTARELLALLERWKLTKPEAAVLLFMHSKKFRTYTHAHGPALSFCQLFTLAVRSGESPFPPGYWRVNMNVPARLWPESMKPKLDG